MPTCAGANKAPAIGTPDARLFFEPQNSSTIASSRGKRTKRASMAFRPMISARMIPLMTSSAVRSTRPSTCQMPFTTAALKAV